MAGLAAIAGAASSNGLVSVLDYSIMYLIVVGSLLVVKKKIETWWLFLAADLSSVPMLLLSGSYVVVFAGVISAMNDVAAIRQWRKVKDKKERL